MDRLHALRVFIEVAEAGSFAAAARRLGLSPPAVTRAVAALEAALGARLLHRTTRALHPTETGARYLDDTSRILAALDDADRTARGEATEPRGRIVVLAPAIFGRRHVAPLLADVLARHPAMQAELRLADRIVNLVEEGADLAIRIGRLADSTLVARRLGATRRLLVAAPAYLDRRGVPQRPEDLARHELIGVETAFLPAEWRFWTTVHARPATPRFVTDSGEAALAAARAGLGVAPALGYQVADDLAAGTLHAVLASAEPPPLPVQAVFPSARLLPAKARVFIEAAVAAAPLWRL